MTKTAYLTLLLALLLGPHLALATEQFPDSTEHTCSALEDVSWKPQEKLVWRHVCAGEPIDFSQEPEYMTEDSRVLSSTFIESILLQEKYRRATTRLGVRISHATFSQTIDLQDAEISHFLGLHNCLFEADVNLNNVKSDHVISFAGSTVRGTLNLRELRIAGSLNMSDTDLKILDLQSAHVGGILSLQRAKVNGHIDMNATYVEAALLMTELAADYIILRAARASSLSFGSVVRAHVDLREAYFEHDVELAQSKVGGDLLMSSAIIRGNLRINDTAFNRGVFTGLQIRRVELQKVIARIELRMDGVRVETDVSIKDCEELQRLSLARAHIGGSLALRQLDVRGNVDLQSMQLEGALTAFLLKVRSMFELSGARVTGNIYLQKSQIPDGLLAFDLEAGRNVYVGVTEFGGELNFARARINGTIDLSHASLQTVDFTSAQVNELALGGADSSPRWSQTATLILRNARIGLVPNLSDGWAPTLDLDGLTYQHVRDTASFNEWFSRQGYYTSQPYIQLASILQNRGDYSQATAVRYAGKERERHVASGWAKIWLTILDWSIGYGYYVERALAWVIVLVTAGTLSLRFSDQGWRNGLRSRLDQAAYSFDMLLPIIKLRESHYHIDLDGWPRYYFYFHKIMGYLLASFLIAGVSGLTKL